MKLPEPTSDALNEELPDSAIASAARALPAGARLDEFDVEEIIGEGSVEIVYGATDRALAVPLAIAEYMPARLAQRNEDAQVRPRTSGLADAFATGLKAFIDETRMLARCDHPSLVRIVRLLEANGTAYRVMPRYLAGSLLEARRGMKEPPDEESVRTLLEALLGALEALHHAGGCHGKVTPSNILLLADNRPLLLGPGAADRALAGDRIDALMTSVEPCFEPLEQIVETDTPIHPSVDLYALAGVARYWMSGQLPAPVLGAPGTARRETLAETVQHLYSTWPRLRYSASLLDALDSALSIYPAKRPQSVAQMRERLGTAPSAANGAVSPARIAIPVVDDAMPSSPEPAHVTQDLDAVIPVAPDHDPLATSGLAHIDDSPLRKPSARQPPNPGLNPGRIAIGSGAALLLLALLFIGTYQFRQEPEVRRVLDVLGINRDTGGGDRTTVSAPAVGPAAPAVPPIAAPEAAKPMPTEPVAAESLASEPAPASPASPNDTTPAAEATAAPAVVAKPPAPALPKTRVAQQRAARGPASPREACGARTQFSLYRCMQTQCSQRQWTSHPQCQRLRATDSID